MKYRALSYGQRLALTASGIALTPTPVYASDFSGIVYDALIILVLIAVMALALGALTAALVAFAAKRKWNWGVCLGSACIWAVIVFMNRFVLFAPLLW